jgi:hypothetical protein
MLAIAKARTLPRRTSKPLNALTTGAISTQTQKSAASLPAASWPVNSSPSETIPPASAIAMPLAIEKAINWLISRWELAVLMMTSRHPAAAPTNSNAEKAWISAKTPNSAGVRNRAAIRNNVICDSWAATREIRIQRPAPDDWPLFSS